jgi:predicted ATPase/class 3 adenylate cyclase/predicted metal-dependent HD superfamily phosphohydrolase
MLEINDAGKSTAIVMEDFNGISLSDFLKQHYFSTEQFLVVAIQLASILTELHGREIIHRDFNPANFLIDTSTYKIKLVDFSIAKLPTQDLVAITNDRNMGSNFQYISPEQTSRTNRIVDHRSDFYSLGVILYEMATHTPPFNSADPGELVHAHIARVPEPPSAINAKVPSVISSIIMKLLEKAPEMRYKTARGLKLDFEVCHHCLKEKGAIEFFRIAQNDKSDRFFIPQKLYGRDKEVRQLMEAFGETLQGNAAMVMISGFSGIGKSSLIEEVRKYVIERGGFFTSGKYDQFHRDIPYGAGVSAFRSLVRQLLSESDETIASWKQKMTQALGINAQLITNVIPEVELIIGKQPDIIPLPAAEALNRVNLIFLTFIQMFASKENPLVVFLDDLQWVDIPTLKLIRLLMADKETSYLLLIGTYRDNEVTTTHPLSQMIADVKEMELPVEEITLHQLQFEDVNQLIADTLLSEPSDCIKLSEQISNKTAGNPFFINEFLKSLYNKKLIHFDYTNDKWVWDIDEILNLDITDNVVELMIGKIKQIDQNAQLLCMYASCIGNKFDLQTLSHIYEKPVHETATDLWPAVREGLIQPIGNTYIPAVQHDEAGSIQYRFLHDRVQQASYALVKEENKRALHLRIGRLMQKNYTEEKKREQIFDLMNHLNFGAPLMEDEKEKTQTASLNLYAGKRAKVSAAYDPAFKFLQAGINILPGNSWNENYTLSLDLYNEGAEAAYLSGNIDEMEKLTFVILSKTNNIKDRIKAYRIQVNGYVSLAKNEEAFKTGEICLRSLGVHFPSNPNKLNILLSLIKCKLNLRKKSADYLLSIPEMKDGRQSAIMEILSDIASPSYFAKRNLFPLIVFKQINLSVKYGNHMHTAFAYATYGIIMCGSTFEFDEGLKYGNLAVDLNEKFHAESLSSKVHFINGNFIQNWRHHYSRNLPEILESYHKGLETGDFLFASYAAFNYCVLEFFMNDPLPQLLNEMEAYALSLRKIKQDLGLRWLSTVMQTTDILREANSTGLELSGKYYKENVDKRLQAETFDYTGLCVYAVNKILLCYLFNRPNEVIKLAEDAFKIIDNVLAWPHVIFLQTMYALSILRMAEGKSGVSKKLTLYKAKQVFKKIDKAAKSAPENYIAKMYLVKAELNRLNKNNNQAATLYDKAIEAAINSKFMLEEALSNELAGRFYAENSDADTSSKYMLEARRVYQKWGAFAKVNALDNEYKLKSKTENREGVQRSSHLNSKPSVNQTNVELDINSLMKASLAISGEILLAKMVEKLMSVVIENAGAQIGYLIINKDGNWVIAGTGSVNDKEENISADVPLQKNKIVPESVVNYVTRTREDLVIENISADNIFSDDPVVQDKKNLSVLCIPILNQRKLTGILYLENNLYTGVFTKERVEFLKLLSGQIAVSLDNALIYQSLEEKVKERTIELEKQNIALENEKKKSDNLLLNILPAETAEELKTFGFAKPKMFSNITVMFTDFVNFTSASEKMDADQLVREINFYYSAFDEIISKYGLEKIKTIGDSYMCAGGLPVTNETHALDIIKASLEIQQFIAVSNVERKKINLPPFECRIGIHSGPVIAGIVGIKKFAYDIWGDTVNIASRMESGCEPAKINLSGTTYDLIKSVYDCTYRGKIVAKNKGLIDMYFLDIEKYSPVFSPVGAENFIKAKLKRNLPPQLTYHGFHHTEDVLGSALQIAATENINESDVQLLRVAVLFHDSGFTELYKDHEEKGCELAKEVLPFFGFQKKDIDCICGMIMATKIPQKPLTKLEGIICDADLDYLGRDDFYTIGKTLFEEFKTFDIVNNEKQWDEIQIRFLESHSYHTDCSRQKREPEKQKYLAALKKKYRV